VRVLAVLSVLIIALHNLTDGVTSTGLLWSVLHRQALVMVGKVPVVVSYPLIPWIAVMSAGFCFGQLLVMDSETRQKWLLRLGLDLLPPSSSYDYQHLRRPAALVEANHRRIHRAFILADASKYPPSLDFLLMTLGPGSCSWPGFYRVNPAKSSPLVVIGRVPLFYFTGHLFLAHLLTIPFALVRYGRAAFLWNPPNTQGATDPYPPAYGYPLWIVYIVWVLVVGLMYPLCLWFGKLKQRSQSRWLAYM